MSAKLPYRTAIVLGASLVVALAAAADSAAAAMPWWHIDTISAPAAEAGGEGRLVLEVSNLGDGAVNGAAHPVSVVDALPAGIVPTHVYGEGGGSSPIGIKGAKELTSCKIEGQVVSCVYDGPLLAYERLMIAITVQVQPGAGGGISEATVEGGAAARAVLRRPLGLSETPSPFGVELYELTPEEEGGAPTTQAGAHPFQLTTTLIFNTKAAPVKLNNQVLPEVQPIALTKDLRFTLPPGLVGNPTPLPKCPLSVFVKPSSTVECPNDTVVGVVTPITTNPFSDAFVPFAETVPLYSVEPSVGEPARFGFNTPVGPVVLDTSVRVGDGYPVIVSVPDIVSDLAVIGSQVTFWGTPGDSRHNTARGSCLDKYVGGDIHHVEQLETSCPIQGAPQPFLIMPTSCEAPLRTSVESDSWADIGRFTPPREYAFSDEQGRPLPQDGCNRLSFEPSITVTPNGRQASTPSGLTVDVHVDQGASLDPNGLAESTVKDTTVALPAGVVLNPAAADGLLSCGLGEIGLEAFGEQACPEAAKVGLVKIKTPLLPNPLEGAAYLATQETNPFGSLVALYIVVYDPVSGVRVKLAGEVTPDPVTGQLVSTFKGTPQLPFEDLQLEFFGGSRAPLGTPPRCGSYTTDAQFAPWSGQIASQVSSPPFQITSGPNNTPCSGSLPFAPELAAGSTNLQAGAFTPFTTTMSREDGNQNLSALQVHLPAGLSGLLTGVELCPEPQASQGLCGPGSLIGETTVSVGLGGTPYSVKGGKVYLTGPYQGAPFGLSIVNPAKAGPFDLAATKNNHPACDCVLVRAKVEVNPVTAAITVTSDTTGPYKIPTILEGIPLQIKHVNVTIDRPGFTFNPTDCEPTKITGTLTSADGATSTLDEPFQVTNCATLGFNPGFAVSTSAHTSRANGASLHVKLTYPKAPFGSQANVKSVKVELPRQLPSRLSTLQKACTAKTFEANPAACPVASVVGHAKAVTPLIPVPLEGPAYFVSYGGAQFPELVVVLQGYGVTLDLHGETFINEKTNVTSSTFRTVPDAPVGSFELTLPPGPFSALAAPSGLCGQGLTMPTAFVAQNGVVLKQATKIAVSGCKPAIVVVRHSAKGGRATIVVQVPGAGRLSAGGIGLSHASKRLSKAGTATLSVSLTAAERKKLRGHPGRKLKVDVKLRFTPSHGQALSTGVAVLVG
jgi:hypothetical protein